MTDPRAKHTIASQARGERGDRPRETSGPRNTVATLLVASLSAPRTYMTSYSLRSRTSTFLRSCPPFSATSTLLPRNPCSWTT